MISPIWLRAFTGLGDSLHALHQPLQLLLDTEETDYEDDNYDKEDAHNCVEPFHWGWEMPVFVHQDCRGLVEIFKLLFRAEAVQSASCLLDILRADLVKFVTDGRFPRRINELDGLDSACLEACLGCAKTEQGCRIAWLFYPSGQNTSAFSWAWCSNDKRLLLIGIKSEKFHTAYRAQLIKVDIICRSSSFELEGNKFLMSDTWVTVDGASEVLWVQLWDIFPKLWLMYDKLRPVAQVYFQGSWVHPFCLFSFHIDRGLVLKVTHNVKLKSKIGVSFNHVHKLNSVILIVCDLQSLLKSLITSLSNDLRVPQAIFILQFWTYLLRHHKDWSQK